jgi:2,3,4,5-tetrahydropyridine-2,6-dicarboxylate N-succinyltransferase
VYFWAEHEDLSPVERRGELRAHPCRSVVVAGSLPSGDRGCQLYCAVIVKQVDARTRAKTSINDLLRS